MVSPAGTPHYNVQPEFTVPGAYFSPLTSPLLHAQNTQYAQQCLHRPYYTNPSTAPSSNATSPIDTTLDVEVLGDGMSLPEAAAAPAQVKKSRRKIATPRSVANGKVRQSPIQKPQKRKSGTLASVVASRDVDDITMEVLKSGNLQPSSEDGSISPEPLNESVMGPPPKPSSSLTRSPAIAAQHQPGAKAAAAGAAATPKSILSRRNQHPINGEQGSAHPTQSSNEVRLDDLELPEAAEVQPSRRPPPLSQIDTQTSPASSTEQTPRLSARKTPKLGPLDTPSAARPGSALASPSVGASPVIGSTPAVLLKDRKNDVKGGKGNKKRSSVSTTTSNVVSPALRPRISPSIKPLLPEGSKSAVSMDWL